MEYKIYISPPSHSEKEIEACNAAIKSNWLSTQGNFVNDFTTELKNYFDSNILLTNSGTSAIHLALIESGVEKDDFVLCSNFTFAASAFPILYQNAVPVFIGSEPNTWNLSSEYLIKAIKNLPKKPKALVLTHVYGMPADIIPIKNICEQNGITLIEDAAEAMGSTFEKQRLGTFGEFGIISFNGNKIITCTAGGAFISKIPEKIEHAKKIASQAKENADFYDHKELGFNYLQSNILSAIGLAQYSNLQERIEKRRSIFSKYVEALASYSEIQFQLENEQSFSNFWLSSFIFPKGVNKTIKENLKINKIESRFLFKPLNTQKIFEKYLYFGSNIENEIFENGLSLPSGFQLNDDEQLEIINIVKNSLEKRNIS